MAVHRPFYISICTCTYIYIYKQPAVNLLAIANAKLVKKYGIERILEPIIRDINILHGGVPMVINGVERQVFGKALACTGDTLGQHLWGGYKEGVGVSCQVSQNKNFTLRIFTTIIKQ